MIDCLDKQQQQQQNIAPQQFWLQQQQQQPRGPPNLRFPPADGQVIQQPNQQQTALHHQQYSSQQKSMLIDAPHPAQNDVQQAAVANSNNNELIGYYFGSISRETAEWILKNHGQHLNGAYLLRSSGPKDDFVLSLMVVHEPSNEINHQQVAQNNLNARQAHLEVLHYKIVETEDSFVALHGQVGDEKFATIDELIDKAQGVATKPRWPIQRQSLEFQILPPTFWGLTVDQVRLAILIKAKQWGFPLSIFQQPQSMRAHHQLDPNVQQKSQHQQQYLINVNGQIENAASGLVQENLNGEANVNNVTTLNNETIRTLIYKSLHEFQPWFHGKISRDEAERRIEDGQARDGRFLVRERDNYSYAMCICHKKTTKHYRIDVLPTGELAIQDGRKFTSLMALVSHYTIMSDGLWCALTEPCPRPIQANGLPSQQPRFAPNQQTSSNNIYCIPPSAMNGAAGQDGLHQHWAALSAAVTVAGPPQMADTTNSSVHSSSVSRPGQNLQRQSSLQQQNANTANTDHNIKQQGALICPNQSAAVLSIKAPIKEWLHNINHKWSQLIASKTNQQHQSLNSFLFGSSNPLNNHCRHHRNHSSHHHHHHHQHNHHSNSNNNHQERDHRRRCSKSGCSRHQQQASGSGRQHKTPQAASNNGQSQTTAAMTMRPNGGTCDCCCSNTGNSAYPVQTMIQNRMLPAGGESSICSGGLVKSPLLPATVPPNNLVVQYIGTHANGNNGGGGDQLVTGGATQAAPGNDYTKALLSCLPQTSGFMLDSQSFIGSPLFAVKTHTNPNGTIDGFTPSGRNKAGSGNRANSMNGMGANGSSGSGGGNNVEEEKLISPAQSISADLNNQHLSNQQQQQQQQQQTQQQQANPYALNTDIYGSQTSTAIVNDHLLTSSSSSSGNNVPPIQRMPSFDLKQHQQRMNHPHPFQHQAPLTNLGQARYGISGPGASNGGADQQNGLKLVQSKTSHLPVRLANGQQYPAPQQTTNFQSTQQAMLQQQSIGATQMGVPPPPVQHAGPIVCGQHAGPAYRYTNCTGDQSLVRPCYHSRTLGVGSHRALDDLQLMTPSTQLGGPAALTKFVQFQDGQCLRTHRDTKSIQMAYLLSRQEALDVLNSRNNNTLAATLRPGGAGGLSHQQRQMTMQAQNYPTQNGHHHMNGGLSHKAQVNQHQFTSSPNGFTNGNQQLQRQASSQFNAMAPKNARQEQQRAGQQEDQIDFDLMDCDGKGFQFKYDPKLIKSSSIETLCGANDDCEDECLEDLSNFKTNSELLMSLKSCWPTNQQQHEPCFDILSPMVTNPDGEQPQQQEQNNELNQMPNYDLDEAQMDDHLECLASLMGQNSGQHGHSAREMDENLRKKHDLDDLTTSLLAELTASLKAQVELKNKRSGLCSSSSTAANGYGNSSQGDNASQSQQKQQDEEDRNKGTGSNPRELINEFDTLISNNRP